MREDLNPQGLSSTLGFQDRAVTVTVRKHIVCGGGFTDLPLIHPIPRTGYYGGIYRFQIPSGFHGWCAPSSILLHEFMAPGWRRSMFRRHGPALSLSRHGPNKKSVKKCAAGDPERT